MKTLNKPSQAECDCINALRDFEAAHRVWMNTSIFTEEGRKAKADKDRLREVYCKTYEAAYRNHLAF